MSKTGMLAAVAAAAGLSETAETTVDAAFLSTNFPDLVAAFKAEGAKLERERIAGLEAAALPGHEKLLADYKADGTKTAGDLALAIVAAERQTRSSMLGSLAEDEARVKGLKPEPANGTTQAEGQGEQPALSGEVLWKADFAKSQDLQAEFASEASYLAFKRAEARGGIKVMAPRRT